jgi:S-(hydroxymethyl)glutathione dehydrogenase/alcohol dehydrogenase
MKAAILTELNEELEIADIEPCELNVGQVLVKVIVSGICGSQLHEIRGNKGNGKFLPHLMGHEGCGEVVDVGPGVTTVSKGDLVVMHWRPGSGIESSFPQYKLGDKIFSSGKVNTLCEYSIASENRLTSVPTDTDPELAALLGCALSTALGLVDHQLSLKLGEKVAVLGVGGVGLNILQAARLHGASQIIAIDQGDAKRELSLRLGADLYYPGLADMTELVDVLVDTTGNVKLIDRAFEKLSADGRIFLVGQPEPGESLEITNTLKLFNGQGVSLKATQGGGTNPSIDIPRYLQLFVHDKLSVKDLITHRFTLDQVNEGFEVLKSGKAGRIMIKIAEGRE